jgi:hypothetical protein
MHQDTSITIKEMRGVQGEKVEKVEGRQVETESTQRGTPLYQLNSTDIL